MTNTLQAGQKQYPQAQLSLFPDKPDKNTNTPNASRKIFRQNIQTTLENPHQYELQNLKSAQKEISPEDQKKLESILQNIEALAKDLHKDHTRQAKDFYTGKPAPYTWHLSAVANETKSMALHVDPELLAVPIPIMQMVAWLHDSVEDGKISLPDLQKKLEELIPNQKKWQKWILEGVSYLTKPDWKDFLPAEQKESPTEEAIKQAKKERDIAYYERLFKAPLWVKIIKLADNKHNFSTLDGKAELFPVLKNVEKVRTSWDKIFTTEEQTYLQKKRILPKNPEGRTAMISASVVLLDPKKNNVESNETKEEKEEAEKTFIEYYTKAYQELESIGYFEILQETTPEKMIISASIGKYCNITKYYQLLNIANKVFPQEKEKIDWLIRNRAWYYTKEWSEKYQYIYNIMNRKRGIPPKILQNMLDTDTNSEKQNIIEEALYFLMKIYASKTPSPIAMQGVQAILRIFYKKRCINNPDWLQKQIQKASLEVWQTLYRSHLAVDFGDRPYSPTEHGFNPRMIELEIYIEQYNNNHSTNITGRYILDLDPENTAHKSMWSAIIENRNDENINTHIQSTEIKQNSDEIQKIGIDENTNQKHQWKKIAKKYNSQSS